MDPEKALSELRELIKKWNKSKTLLPLRQAEDVFEVGDEIVNRFEDLDEWLSKGGFLPEDWRVSSARSQDGK